jgi:hypothetical protein
MFSLPAPAPPSDSASPSPAEFALVLSDGKRFPCPAATARTYSPEIDTFIEIQPGVTDMPVDLSDSSDQFPLIITLLTGGSIPLDPATHEFLSAAASALGLSPLLNAIRKQTKTDNIVAINPDLPKNFFGIVRYLWDAEEFEVQVSVSSCTSFTFAENLTSRTNPDSIWESEDRPRPWVVFDFDKYSVKLSGYGIQAAGNSTDYRHPQTWLVCGSNDQDEWVVLDEQEGNQELVGGSEALLLGLEEEVDEYFRYIRVMMTGPNHRGDWVFRLARMEFYGSIKEE